ncbi:MAG: tRNA threonylcarbamoyl adenosine modification protein TsaD [Francisellaceae bacterium]|nr:tRNA threonylcarbamoyl adenosine modification protein TsaD [Francisellaceae bacterium]
MYVLGIETSCDETGLALYSKEKGLIGHVLNSQVALHAQYGGVVPELASRDHIQKIIPLLNSLLAKTNSSLSDISAIAYTAGPGLMGALLVGACFAKGLSFALNVPAIGVHHLEGHFLAPFLESKSLSFPFLALLVSGGHTLLVKVNDLGDYTLLGESLDDAAGEAFDKMAKLLGLAYPGGPLLAKLAEQGDDKRFKFPRPLTQTKNLNFSFSGLKTHTLLTFKKTTQSEQDKRDVACAFQEAVVDVLSIKCRWALEATGLKTLVVAGGVGANLKLREKLKQLAMELNMDLHFPRIEFCTDNGAMIALAGSLHLDNNEQDESLSIKTRARWPLENLKNNS